MRILGVDPGLRLTGYGCLDFPDAPEPGRRGVRAPLPVASDRPSLLEAGVIRLRAGVCVADRLVELEEDLSELVERLRPDGAAVEGLFSHYQRPTTAVAMGHARGVILLCLRRAGLPIEEIKPTRVKKSLTGFGHASKAQVQEAIRARLNLREAPSPPDVADAIALALCAAHSVRRGATARR